MATGRKILLVEDDRDQAELFASVLTMAGYEVVTALNAEVGMVDTAEERFDLLLVDWDLPRMKGDVFISRMKAEHPGIKAVLFSNHTNIEPIAHACGADAWMLKTDGIVRLREIVAELMAAV